MSALSRLKINPFVVGCRIPKPEIQTHESAEEHGSSDLRRAISIVWEGYELLSRRIEALKL